MAQAVYGWFLQIVACRMCMAGRGPLIQRTAYFLYFTFGRTHNISYSRFAPTSAVLPDGSYGGEISTRSHPTISSPRQPRMISSACQIVRPPISGVPVPGAKLGSRPSISKLRYTGPAPSFARTSAMIGATDLYQHSSACTTRMPCDLDQSKSSAV